jgi:SAM-dependent methyltransferase
VVRARYDKFRQINRFLEVLDHALKDEEKEEICVVDFGCGRSYLTFLVYYYFSVLKKRRVKIIGYDLKREVVEECSALAKKYGYNGLTFEVADVTRDRLTDEPIDMVISLHACDTATDLVLDFASRTRASAILATPCCQHELNGKLDCPTLSFIAERPILRQKFCAVATDALRLLKLEAEGYRTDATELIDPEDTPKNVMLRAFLRPGFDPSSPEGSAARTRYEETRQFLYGAKP